MAKSRFIPAGLAAIGLVTALGSSAALAVHPQQKAPEVPGRTALEKKNIAAFDQLDFEHFSHRNWKGFEHNHAKDIVVYWPDGHTTKGLERHLQDMEWMFSFAPDTRVSQHNIRVAENDWTAVTGVLEQTFTKPMETPDGKVIQPTGKKVKLPMATFAKWKNGVMTEEHLFWDNQEWYRQLGIKN